MSERPPDGERLTGSVDHAIIYLVPVGSERFELYSEPLADAESESDHEGSGFWRNLALRSQARWREVVRTARHAEVDDGFFSRARHAVVRRTADAIAEQRTLWTLRRVATAELVHPSDRSSEDAAEIRDRILNRARTHHLRWLFVDTVLLVASGVFVIIPGPNLIAYYFAFRVAGHSFSWRGARQALQVTRWHLRSEPALAELGQLAHLPRDTRAPRLHAIATDLNLPRLAAFFDRMAA